MALWWMAYESYWSKAPGVCYKSRGEEQIARLLDRNGVEYFYEYPLAIMDEGKLRIYYPDFTLPGNGLIIEYFGMRGNSEYDRQKRHKIAAYRKAGIDGVFLADDCFNGDWPSQIMGQIERVLVGRVERFCDRRVMRR